MSCQSTLPPIPDWTECPEVIWCKPFSFTGTIQDVRRIGVRFEIDILSGERKSTVSGNGNARGVLAGQVAEGSSDENGRITIKNVSTT